MKIKSLLSVSVVLCVTARAGSQNISSSTVELLKQTVVPVACVGYRAVDHNVYLISIEGTGFFSGEDGDIVTAGHVAKGIFAGSRIPVCDVQAIYVPIAGWNPSNPNVDLRVIAINRCWWDDDLDVAVCALTENPFTSPNIKTRPLAADFSAEIQNDGTAVAFTGFPLSFLQPITSQGTVGTYRGIAGETLGPREVVIDKNAWPGASGSPVYTSKGKVIGLVVQRGFNDASGLAFARTTPYIQKFLADNKAEREKQRRGQQQR